MIRYKEELLRDDQPRCDLTRIAVDLTKDDQRISTFKKLGDEISNALIITEGLIGYLTNEQAGKLATDLAIITSFEYWIMDYNQGKWRKNRGGRDVVKFLQDKAPIQFSSDNPIAFFEERGWKVKENIFILDEAERLGRKMPMFFMWHLLLKIKKVRETGNRTYGYVMYEKASSDF